MPVARRSFRPLELSIYMPTGRISPLPDFDSEQWTSKLPSVQRPQSAVLRREIMDNSELPIEFRRKPLSISTIQNPRSDILSEPFLSMSGGPGPVIRSDTMESMRDIQDLATIDEDRTPTLHQRPFEEDAPLSSRSGAISPPLRMRSPSPFSLGRSRSKISLDGISRNASVRRSKSDTIDDAIRELNTIVEQKRVKEMMGARDSMESSAPLSPSSHVPAIAPSMRLRARSSTLSDIGSAFSISYTDKPMPAVPSPCVASTDIHMSRSPFPALRLATSNSPALSSGSSSNAVASSRTTTKSRLSTWLRLSMPASPATPTSQEVYQMTPSASTPGLIQNAQGGHIRNSSSLSSALSGSYRSSLSTRASSPYVDATETPATTIAGSMIGAPTTPDELFPTSLPSVSKTPRLRRTGSLKMGLSIDTTLSNGSVLTQAMGPPAYEEVDSNPNTGSNNKEAFGLLITPSRVGVAF
ncbi:Drug resistance protein [Venturia nashicola]|nr:Drug resistance protein [Venturia nashicola]